MSEAAPFLEELRRHGHVFDPQARLTPLSGGVSSEIYLVQDGEKKFVVKRALAKLKVKEDWFADVSRNASEWSYLECVGRLLPGAVPQVRFTNREAGYFGMEFLGDGYVNWKQALLAGDCQTEHAQLAGHILGQIHRLTSADDSLRKQFDTTENFHQLRLDPYLAATASRHPELRDMFMAGIRRIEGTREALVHGDFSPKNILLSGSRMVVLDCEVAWYGDPAFDVAFLLNHLFLKWLRHVPRDLGMEKMIAGFWRQYLASSGREAAQFAPRVLRLLPLLMLARVDGKSPVEYLDDSRRDFIRRFVSEELHRGRPELTSWMQAWLEKSRNLPPIMMTT
jgi:5-methylthioribose kinase